MIDAEPATAPADRAHFAPRRNIGGDRPIGISMSADPLWYVTKDGDLSCLELYERHYSCYDYRDGRKRSQFVGPGEHIVLRTGDADAMFVWRKFIDDSGQSGVNCAVFRNEAPHRYRSSELVRQADAVA